jgi:hypothetical protein
VEQLPDDPAAASAEDLVTLAAAQQGLTCHAIAAQRRLHELATAVMSDTFDLDAALSERTDVLALLGRVDTADRLLNDYCRAAVAARGVNLDALAAALNQPPNPKDPA